MYMGIIEEFLSKKRLLIYDVMTESELMTHYLEIIRCAKNPLYPHQSKKMMNVIHQIEEYISDEMIQDLKSLSDKDLILKYDLKPQTVSSKYVGVDVYDIKASAINRVNIDKVKEMNQNEYDIYEKRGWL